MPTYEFRCPKGHEFERFYRKMSDAEPEVSCPECGAVAARQLSAGAGLLFKGSGFYLTDYGKNAHRKSGPAAAGTKSTDGKSEGGAGGDSKAAGDSKAGEAKSTESKGSATGGGEKPAAPTKSSPGGSSGSGGDKA